MATSRWRSSARATQLGGGRPATGKSVDIQLIDMFAFADDGRVREHWGVIDLMAMMQQLGVVPAGPPA